MKKITQYGYEQLREETPLTVNIEEYLKSEYQSWNPKELDTKKHRRSSNKST